MKVFFERREQLAPAIWQYYFRPERPVSFVPGQYVDLQLPGVIDDPRGAARTFTLTSLPADPYISFIVKFQDQTSKYKLGLADLDSGSEAKIGDAMGDVILPKDPSTPLVFVAGGIGLASYASIVRWLTERKEGRDITLFYAVRYQSEIILEDLFGRYPFPLPQSTVIAPNRLQSANVAAKVAPDSLVYISGSQKFVEGMRNDLQTAGVHHERIIFDFFDGYAEL